MALCAMTVECEQFIYIDLLKYCCHFHANVKRSMYTTFVCVHSLILFLNLYVSPLLNVSIFVVFQQVDLSTHLQVHHMPSLRAHSRTGHLDKKPTTIT